VADSGRTVFGGGGGLALNGGFSPLPHLYVWTNGTKALNSGDSSADFTTVDMGPIDDTDDTTDGAISVDKATGVFTVTETGVYVISFLATKSDDTTPAMLVCGPGSGWFGPAYSQPFNGNDTAAAMLTVPLGAGATFEPRMERTTTDVGCEWMELQVARIL
jgi:hypothetical protein